MRNKTIRVAVVGAMLVSFVVTVSPVQARDRRPLSSSNRGSVTLLTQLGDVLRGWASGFAEALAGKSTPPPASGTPVRSAETSAASTDRSAAIDPWGVR